jgi:hypothetical protein
MSLRMFDQAHPKRLDFVNLKLDFPSTMGDDWLLDAELICYKKIALGVLKLPLSTNQILIPNETGKTK